MSLKYEPSSEPQTKHFLLIGFLAMLIGSIVFGSFVVRKADNKMQVPAFFLFFTLVTGPRRSLSLQLSDTRAQPSLPFHLSDATHMLPPFEIY